MSSRRRGGASGVDIELVIECRDAGVAKALDSVLMPDNRYFPKDQKFGASGEGPVVRFDVSSPRVRPALSTVASIISDSGLFRDLWVEVEEGRRGSVQGLSPKAARVVRGQEDRRRERARR